MQLEVGKIYEGKVTGITKFGAFVELEPGTTGMVHISEVANSFVSEIKDHITEGQQVKVKVLSIGDDGKISLSIKKAVDNPPPQRRPFNRDNNSFRQGGQGGQDNQGRQDGGFRQDRGGFNNRPFGNRNKPQQDRTPPTPEAAFEDMLNKFKANSDERMVDIKRNIDNKRKNTRRRG